MGHIFLIRLWTYLIHFCISSKKSMHGIAFIDWTDELSIDFSSYKTLLVRHVLLFSKLSILPSTVLNVLVNQTVAQWMLCSDQICHIDLSNIFTKPITPHHHSYHYSHQKSQYFCFLPNYDLPSSGAAEAPSGSIGCNSPVSELFSKSDIGIPSRRPPLALALKKEENDLIFSYN